MKKRKKIIIYSVIIFLALLLAGGAVYFALAPGMQSARQLIAGQIENINFSKLLGTAVNAEYLVEENTDQYREVLIKYNKNGANEVFVAGSFNDWVKEPLVKLDGGGWQISKKLPGNIEFYYKFFVNNEWANDPLNVVVAKGGIKGSSSVIEKSIVDLYAKKPEPVESYFYGRVKNRRGSSLRKVTIKITPKKGKVFRALTNRKGKYATKKLSAGDYEVKAWKKGYKASVRYITIENSKPIKLDFILKK